MKIDNVLIPALSDEIRAELERELARSSTGVPEDLRGLLPALLEVVQGILARHDGVVIENDPDLPVASDTLRQQRSKTSTPPKVHSRAVAPSTQAGQTPAAKVRRRTVREFGGELHAELRNLANEYCQACGEELPVSWQEINALVDLAMIVMAHHAGKTLKNDPLRPLNPLPSGAAGRRTLLEIF